MEQVLYYLMKGKKTKRRQRGLLDALKAALPLILFIIFLGWLLWPQTPQSYSQSQITSQSPAQSGAGRVVEVQADMAGFRPNIIRARVGEKLTVRLVSLDNEYHVDGGGKHQFAIDEMGVNIVAPPLGASEASFTPTQAGTYVFYCDICCGGRNNPSMRGQLIVES